MRSKTREIKKLFLQKLIFSSAIQIFVLALLIIFIKNYIAHSQLNTIADALLINDQYTIDQIASFYTLEEKYALDLELHNIGEMRLLDSIKFVKKVDHRVQNSGCTLSNGRNFRICKFHDSYTGISAVKLNNIVIGYIISQKRYKPTFSISIVHDLTLILLAIVSILIFNFLFLFLSITKKVEKNTKILLGLISSENLITDSIEKLEISEYKTIFKKFISEQDKISKLQNERSYYQARKKIAEQVAHDIRSPLIAITTALSDAITISENKRIMIRNASKRINDIANNLLAQSKNEYRESNTENSTFSELIFVVLDNIVSEKRYEYSKSAVNIQLNVSKSSYTCFAEINLASFKRVLSNIINNSIEAIKDSGSVILYLILNKNTVDICIHDNGCGIPENVISKVTEQGFSYNKKNGVGLGLSYAKDTIEQLNGRIQIDSKMNVGTKVTISLPRADYPIWFCSTLNINSYNTIVVLDDDPSVHEAWNNRLHLIQNIKIIHFFKSSDLYSYKINTLNSTIYLIDYELLADNINGIDVIKHLNLREQSFLVTSSFEDISVRNRCAQLGVKIIPKSYVPYIPIIRLANPSIKNQLVFIDDDEIMRTIWMLAAEEAGLTLLTYSSPTNFSNDIDNYSKDTVIYIDSDLGNNLKGEEYAKELYAQGFTEIYLTTGHSSNYFGELPWIKSIVDKNPPFLFNKNTE